jgi:hypothetical protein
MKKMSSQYQNILAIFFGIATYYFSSKQTFIVISLTFLVCGGLFGFLWPRKSWRWGIWLLGPVLALISFSVLFAGQLEVFFKKDLPSLMVALISASLGSYISARLKGRYHRSQ